MSKIINANKVYAKQLNSFSALKKQSIGTYVAVRLDTGKDQQFFAGKITCILNKMVLINLGEKHIVVQERDFNLFTDFIYLIMNLNHRGEIIG